MQIRCPYTPVFGQPGDLSNDLVDSDTCKANGEWILGSYPMFTAKDITPFSHHVRSVRIILQAEPLPCMPLRRGIHAGKTCDAEALFEKKECRRHRLGTDVPC
jgi:hypothetical protein